MIPFDVDSKMLLPESFLVVLVEILESNPGGPGVWESPGGRRDCPALVFLGWIPSSSDARTSGKELRRNSDPKLPTQIFIFRCLSHPVCTSPNESFAFCFAGTPAEPCSA